MSLGLIIGIYFGGALLLANVLYWINDIPDDDVPIAIILGFVWPIVVGLLLLYGLAHLFVLPARLLKKRRDAAAS